MLTAPQPDIITAQVDEVRCILPGTPLCSNGAFLLLHPINCLVQVMCSLRPMTTIHQAVPKMQKTTQQPTAYHWSSEQAIAEPGIILQRGPNLLVQNLTCLACF